MSIVPFKKQTAADNGEAEFLQKNVSAIYAAINRKVELIIFHPSNERFDRHHMPANLEGKLRKLLIEDGEAIFEVPTGKMMGDAVPCQGAKTWAEFTAARAAQVVPEPTPEVDAAPEPAPTIAPQEPEAAATEEPWPSFDGDTSAQQPRGSRKYGPYKADKPEAEAEPESQAEAGPDKQQADVKPGVILICAADIEPEPIDWLWKDRFALGKISMIAGQSSIGKSQTTIDMAARITTGREWPNGEGIAPTGNVIFLSAEDDPNDILTPRLMAAGADRKRVFFVSMVKDPSELGSRQRQFNVAKDVGRLCEAIDTVGSVRLVVIDPITAYLGSGKDVDSHRATDVRDALNPLLHYTEKLNIATILINHLNKSGGTDAMNRVIGSGAFVQLARTVYLVVPDSEKERALFLPAKNNLSKKPPGLAYKPITKFISTAKHPSIETSCIEWDIEEIDKTADEALADIAGRVVVGGGGGDPTAVHEAEQFLSRLLMDGPVPVKEIFRQAQEAGLSRTTLKRAKKRLGVMSGHSGDGGPNGAGEWTWEFWNQVDQPLRPHAESRGP